MLVIVAIMLIFVSCSQDHNIFKDDDKNVDDSDFQCGNYEVTVETPVMPEIPEIDELPSYDGATTNCAQTPEIIEGKLVLGDGCYRGCITVSGNVVITGSGCGKTALFCDDVNALAVINIKENSSVTIEKITLKGLTRGIFAEKKSTVFINETVISDCLKGGINVCGGESDCGSELFFERSVIENIVPENQTEISYGISMGPGTLSVEDSVLHGFNS
ncbi:MAG TPA: hypothetical protein VLJ60_02535, partial [bacterium]|nr:hypothetical protein [bacterium]